MKPTRAEAIELLDMFLNIDWQGAMICPTRFEVTLIEVTKNDAHLRLDEWLSAKGIDEGVEIVPDTIEGDFGALEGVTIRISTEERVA